MSTIPLYLRRGLMSVWLCVSEEEASLTDVTEQQTDRCLLHVLSMGSKALMLQVWVNISTGAFTFR